MLGSVEVLLELLPPGLGILMPSQLSTAGVMDPNENLCELLLLGQGIFVP